MPVNLIQYRGTVGIFNSWYFVFDLKYRGQSLLNHSQSNVFSHYASCIRDSVLFFLYFAVFLILKLNNCKNNNNSRASTFLVAATKTWLAAWFYSILLLLSGNVELNPGPKHNPRNAFSIWLWNLNSISAHNCAKVLLLKTYIAIHKFDIICISETYLDSSTLSEDHNLEISGYTLVRSDHPSRNKRSGVCIYYKRFLSLRILNVQYLQERICFELITSDKTCNFLSVYRSPSKRKDDFKIGDFNAKSSNWFCQGKTSFEGDATDNLTSQYGLHQVIKKPTYILHTPSSCIDLMFTSQPNLIIEPEVHSSLPSIYCHQVIFAKFDSEVVYSPPYVGEVWHYQIAIRRTFNEFNCQSPFWSTNANEKVDIFNSTILNTLSNFIPRKFAVCDDKDLPWFNKKI